MGQILIRKIDDAALARLQALAKEQGISLEAFARNALEEAAQRHTAAETRDWLDKLEALRMTMPPSSVDSVSFIRRLREGNEIDG